jgi:hypothetical protein
MARVVVTEQDVVVAGVTPTYVAPTVDGISVLNSSDIVVHVKNANASPCNVTTQAPGKYQGLEITDPVVAVPATTGDKMIRVPGGDPTAQADGRCYIDFSIQASVTYAVMRVPK